MTVKFTRDTVEDALMLQIIERADQLRQRFQHPPLTAEDRKSMHMDLAACHANGCPLDLAALLCARDFDFAHDVFGIGVHMDRTTGQLTDNFNPRFALENQQ